MYFFKGKVNRCPKGIDLKNYFQKLFIEKEKENLTFLKVFYISYKSFVKTFLKWSINNCPKDTC